MSFSTTIVFLAVLAIANYRLKRSVVYPPFVFTCIWLLVTFVLSLNLADLDKIHAITLNVICGGALLFSCGGALAFLAPAGALSRRIRIFGPPAGSGRLLRWSMIGALSAGVLLQIRFLMQLAGGAGGTLGFLIAARQEMIDEMNNSNASFRWFTYITTWTVFSALLFRLDRRDRASNVMLWLAFVSCLASTGRGQFLLLFSALTAMHLIRSGKEKFLAAVRFARWPIVAFLALFVILMFTNKDTSKLTVTPAQYVGDSIVGYLCGSTSALDLVLRHKAEFAPQSGFPGTFAPLFRVASALGLLSYNPPPQFENYVYVPVPINTFTVYKGWVLDFGMTLGMLVVAIVGFGQTLLYRLARGGSRLALFLFVLSIYSTIMVFFVDTYSSMSFYAEAAAFGSVYLAIRSISPEVLRTNLSVENSAPGHAKD